MRDCEPFPAGLRAPHHPRLRQRSPRRQDPLPASPHSVGASPLGPAIALHAGRWVALGPTPGKGSQSPSDRLATEAAGPRARPGRGGATLVEALTAGVLALAVVGGAFVSYRMTRRQEAQSGRISTLLAAGGSVMARLRMDLAAAFVPPGADLDSPAFVVGPGATSLAFVRDRRVEDPAAVPAAGPARQAVTWSAVPGGDGFLRLRREAEGEDPVTWPDAPAKEVRFALRKVDGRLFVVAEALLVDGTAGSGPAASGKAIPVRVVRRLFSSARLPLAALSPMPETWLDRIAPPAAPPTVLPGDGSDIVFEGTPP